MRGLRLGSPLLIAAFALAALAQQPTTSKPPEPAAQKPSPSSSEPAQQPPSKSSTPAQGSSDPATPAQPSVASKPAMPRWAVLVDPVCPVISFGPTPPANATKELRVMYFP